MFRSLSVVTLAAAALLLSGCGGDGRYAGLSREGATWGAEHAFIRERVPVRSGFDLERSNKPSGGHAWLAVAQRNGRSTCVWVWASNETTYWYAVHRCKR